uniref:zinc finger protein 593 n=1 Tax=Myxine glutinosa TaxID=7769 RepID=UPI00358DD9E8
MGRSKHIGGGGTRKTGKNFKGKRRRKDLDEVHVDILPGRAERLLRQDPDPDLPGEGQHYCLHCARHFIDQRALKEHFRTKVHKKRLKQLREGPYSQEEAERAAGMGQYIEPKPVEVRTQEVIEPADM